MGDVMGTTIQVRRLAWQQRLGILLASAASFYAGTSSYSRYSVVPVDKVIGLELAGSSDRARSTPCSDSTVPCHESARFVHDLHLDWAFIFGYGSALLLLCYLGARCFLSRRSRRLARAAVGGSVVVILSDALENLALYAGLGSWFGPQGWPWTAAAAAASVKFSLLVPVGAVAMVALLIIGGRLLLRGLLYVEGQARRIFYWLARRKPPISAPRPGRIFPPAPVHRSRSSDEPLWPIRSGATPHQKHDLGRPENEIGICVSGGGIRSACVTLGALQVLREQGVLQRARYLVSVSGGGYMTGAMQLAMRPDHPEEAADAENCCPFTVNSPELDHLRLHGRYIADSFREYAIALVVLMRGLLVSLGLLAVTVMIAGFTLGVCYRIVPQVTAVEIRALCSGLSCPEPATTGSPSVLWGLGTLVTLALLAWLAEVLVRGYCGRDRHSLRIAGCLRVCARTLAGAATVVTATCVAVPAIASALAATVNSQHLEVDIARAAAGGTASTVLLAYGGALIGILWKQRNKIGGARTLFGRTQSVTQKSADGVTQRVIVWLILLLLATIAMGLFVVMLKIGAHPKMFGLFNEKWPNPVAWTAFVTAVLVALFIDQTWTSLHPFYRRRLARAFAVRRQSVPGGLSSVAVPYDFQIEETLLRTYGGKVDNFPQVIFAAAAQLSGTSRTPPGRRATSFTFSHDWVGGPQVGYMETSMIDSFPRQLRNDMTVQSAMAISGAAFASAMGGQAQPVQTLFAVSNARLGTWLPNPAWLAWRDGQDLGCEEHRLPSIRRFTYLLRELLGIYDDDDRLLLVTDGGHYDNLGLVELLRLRCSEIYVIDASADKPPFAKTLAESIMLGIEELGVDIKLEAPLNLVPGSGEPMSPTIPLSKLNARLSRSTVARGVVTYPATDEERRKGLPGRRARLTIMKAGLTRDMPYEIQSYAECHPSFPRDNTTDQAFEHDQFDAYHSLGRYLGQQGLLKSAVSAPPPGVKEST